VAQTRLRGVDDAGLLGRQERLPTPDVPGRSYVQPDYTIYNSQGNVVFYADAKTGSSIGLDAQARGLVQWSKTTTSKTLIYYTPEGTTPISPELLRYAQQNGVRLMQVAVP
jgi:filamentous hemagglutinin